MIKRVKITRDDRKRVNFILLCVVLLGTSTTDVLNLYENFIIIIIVIILNDLKNYVNGWIFYCIPLRMWIILLIRALHCVDQLYFLS